MKNLKLVIMLAIAFVMPLASCGGEQNRTQYKTISSDPPVAAERLSPANPAAVRIKLALAAAPLKEITDLKVNDFQKDKQQLQITTAGVAPDCKGAVSVEKADGDNLTINFLKLKNTSVKYWGSLTPKDIRAASLHIYRGKTKMDGQDGELFVFGFAGDGTLEIAGAVFVEPKQQ